MSKDRFGDQNKEFEGKSLLRFACKRLGVLSLVLMLSSLIIFGITFSLPGDAALIQLGTQSTDETLAQLRADMGLSQGFWSAYWSWISGFMQGDLGQSLTYKVSIKGILMDRIGLSLPLALMALVLATVVGLILGVQAAARHGGWSDFALMSFSNFGLSIPNFWFGILLVLLFSIQLGWLPPGGFAGWKAGIWPGLQSLILPMIALALPQAAILARVTRANLLDLMDQPFMVTAQAKGLTRRQALRRHALRNALIPVVTLMGLQFSFLIAGAIVIEEVFNLPGIGRLIFQSVSGRDLPLVQSLVMLLVMLVIIVTFLVDLLLAVLDPRLRNRAQGHG